MRYSSLVDVYEKVEGTPKRLEKIAHLARFIEEIPADELDKVVLLLQGTVFPTAEEKKIGVAAKLLSKAIALATGYKEIEDHWRTTGDLGKTAAELVKTKKQQTLFAQRITVAKVFANIKKLAELEGEGAVDVKAQYIAELLTSAEPKEAQYIVRTVLGDMRVGAGEGLMRDALVWAYYPKISYLASTCTRCNATQPKTNACVFCRGVVAQPQGKRIINITTQQELTDIADADLIITPNEHIAREVYNTFTQDIQEALDIFNDLPLVARRAKMRSVRKLLDTGLIPGKPLKLMLFQKAQSIKEAFSIVGKPAACEFKYDGFRLQIHRNGDCIKLFTRKLDDVTPQFPDVVEVIGKCVSSHDYILDAEIVGFDTSQQHFAPFQDISQRIQRKYDVHLMSKDVPVLVILFDILELNGRTLIRLPFAERRQLLSSIVKIEDAAIRLAHQLVTDKEDDAAEFYNLALGRGTEGIMVKSLTAPYQPGARVGYGVKIKPTMDTLDLVIVGAEWGEGKRVNMLSSFTVACRDVDKYLELGKVGTGFKEITKNITEGVSFAALTEQLKPLIIREKGRRVAINPAVVLELAYEEIQRSPSYASGFALRFPRLVRLRTDKNAEDCSPLSYVQKLFDEQKR